MLFSFADLKKKIEEKKKNNLDAKTVSLIQKASEDYLV